jgi:small subunit ribosomal protein S16
MQRLGRHNRPFYRIAAVDSRTRRNGPVLEELGWYDPMASDVAKQVNLNEERVKYWVSKGAQASDTVADMLAKRNLIKTEKWAKARESRKKAVLKRKEALAAAAAAAPVKEKK